jgi:hypothetical protein
LLELDELDELDFELLELDELKELELEELELEEAELLTTALKDVITDPPPSSKATPNEVEEVISLSLIANIKY